MRVRGMGTQDGDRELGQGGEMGSPKWVRETGTPAWGWAPLYGDSELGQDVGTGTPMGVRGWGQRWVQGRGMGTPIWGQGPQYEDKDPTKEVEGGWCEYGDPSMGTMTQ